MSWRDQFSKGGFHPLFRMPGSGSIDAVLFATRHHLVLCLTAVVEGRREIVGVEIQPAPEGFKLDSWMEDPGDLRVRAEAAIGKFEAIGPEDLRPVSAALLRGIPLTTVLGFREADVAGRLKSARAYEARGYPDIAKIFGKLEISAEDEARLAYLDDALMYVSALAERSKPAELIAEVRSISKRTAEGRIAKARALGLLTKAVGKTASGELTPEAIRLDEWRSGLTDGEENDDV